MKTCSLGFIFDTQLEKVLLIHKNKPAFQAGKINGVGGKNESGETSLDCMIRECQEETALEIKASGWIHFATIDEQGGLNPGWTIELFTTCYAGNIADARKNDHEEIEWFKYDQLPNNVISNLPFLVPMARQKLLGHDSKEITIRY